MNKKFYFLLFSLFGMGGGLNLWSVGLTGGLVSVVSSSGDHLGNHVATRTLQMEDFGVMNSSGLGVGTANTTSRVDIVGGSLTIRGASNGLRVASLSSCDTIDTNAAGDFVCGADGGGTTVTPSTFPYTRGRTGPVFISSANFQDSGVYYHVGMATANVVRSRAFTHKTSTAGSTFFQIVRTTATDNGSPFNRLSALIEVATGNAYSVWNSSAFTFNPGERYSVQITSHYAYGNLAEDWGMEWEQWFINQTQ